MGKNSHIMDKRRANNNDPQLKSIQLRTHSHLIYECKHSVLTTYRLQSLPPVELAVAVVGAAENGWFDLIIPA